MLYLDKEFFVKEKQSTTITINKSNLVKEDKNVVEIKKINL